MIFFLFQALGLIAEMNGLQKLMSFLQIVNNLKILKISSFDWLCPKTKWLQIEVK